MRPTMARMVGIATVGLVTACSDCPPCPATDSAYYAKVCAAAGMTHLAGTHTCVGADSSFINLAPPKRLRCGGCAVADPRLGLDTLKLDPRQPQSAPSPVAPAKEGR